MSPSALWSFNARHFLNGPQNFPKTEVHSLAASWPCLKLGGGFKYLLFSPLLTWGNDPSWLIFFQMGACLGGSMSLRSFRGSVVRKLGTSMPFVGGQHQWVVFWLALLPLIEGLLVLWSSFGQGCLVLRFTMFFLLYRCVTTSVFCCRDVVTLWHLQQRLWAILFVFWTTIYRQALQVDQGGPGWQI